jgi:rhodanese-related sulfurtransferase
MHLPIASSASSRRLSRWPAAAGLCGMLEAMLPFLRRNSARAILPVSALLLATLCLCQESSTPWRQSELIEPSALARALQSNDPPYVICVAFPILYHGRHITDAIFAGPASKPEGISMLKTAAAELPKDEKIVIYCGCCPMEKCPNVRPAYKALKDLGFKNVRVLDIHSNMHTDWYTRGYPSEGSDKSEGSGK